jgi:hypothetical protein
MSEDGPGVVMVVAVVLLGVMVEEMGSTALAAVITPGVAAPTRRAVERKVL